MKVIFIILLVLGIIVIGQTYLVRADAIGAWSDFKAFENRALQDEAGSRILSYGGENPSVGFSALLDRIISIQMSVIPSALICLFSIVGLIIASREKKAEQGAAANP